MNDVIHPLDGEDAGKILAERYEPVVMAPLTLGELVGKLKLVVCDAYMPGSAKLVQHNSAPVYLDTTDDLWGQTETGFFYTADSNRRYCVLNCGIGTDEVNIAVELDEPFENSCVYWHNQAGPVVVKWKENTPLNIDRLKLWNALESL